MARLFVTKPLSACREEASAEGEHTLRRSLGPINLITLGIGAIIGAGIFVLTGPAAAQFAGPAIVLSFVVAGIGCVFAGLCYAEFASMIPIAGSAYTYGYATLGELMAWIIGWACASNTPSARPPWPWAGAATSAACLDTSGSKCRSTQRRLSRSLCSDIPSRPRSTSSRSAPSLSSPPSSWSASRSPPTSTARRS